MRRQDVSYTYILSLGGRCELSRIVSRFLLTRKTRRVRASLLSSVPRAPIPSFSRCKNKNARQNETVPHLVYTPTFAPSLPETTVTYISDGEQSSAARTITSTVRLRIARNACHRRRYRPPLLIPISMRRHQISMRRHQNLHHEVSPAKNAEHRAEEVAMNRLSN